MTGEKLPRVSIYTGVVCESNPGSGGWAVYLRWDNGNDLDISGVEYETTSNRLHMTATIQALEVLTSPHQVDFYCVDEYVLGTITGKLHGMKNGDLINKLNKLTATHDLYACRGQFNSRAKNRAEKYYSRAKSMAREALKVSA